MEIQVHRELSSWFAWRKGFRGTLGFVPTMGALHEGHLSLIRRAKMENEVVLISLFVNPTQFNNPEDLAKYPRTIEADIEMAKAAGCDHILMPNRDAMYSDDYRYRVTEAPFSQQLCGAHRPGHFDGVLSVVLKLLHIAQCRRAYFGEKDFQQLQLIRGMADAFFMTAATNPAAELEIIPSPTVREADGLAMSSRNRRLTPGDREKAPMIFKILKSARLASEARSQLASLGFDVDYVEDRDGRRFAAASLGGIRLIDNIALSSDRPSTADIRERRSSPDDSVSPGGL